MKRATRLAMCGAVLLYPILFGSAQSPQFEVATVKPSPPRDPNWTASYGFCHGIDNQMPANLGITLPALGRCLFARSSLRAIVSIAYPSPTTMSMVDRIIGGPSWVSAESFEVEGKAEDPASTTRAQLLLMVQQLLSDRFKLQIHTEQKEVQGFVLVVAKGGVRLKPGSAEGTDSIRHGGGTMSANNASIATLARLLASRMGGPVVDHTGLTGGYQFSMPEIGAGDSIVTLLQEEFGLRLEARKIKVDLIVIDHAERPTPEF
jgi:uncharacterized protein (TIGR03435 family)